MSTIYQDFTSDTIYARYAYGIVSAFENKQGGVYAKRTILNILCRDLGRRVVIHCLSCLALWMMRCRVDSVYRASARALRDCIEGEDLAAMAVFIVALAAAAEIGFDPSSAKNGCWSNSEAVGRASSLISNVLCRKLEASVDISFGKTGAESLPIYATISQ